MIEHVSDALGTRERMLTLFCTQLLFNRIQLVPESYFERFLEKNSGQKQYQNKNLKKCFSRTVGPASLEDAKSKSSILWLHCGCTKQPSLLQLHSNIERWFHQYKERHFEVLNAFNAIHTCHSALAYIASVTCNVTKIKLKMLILRIFPQLYGRFSAKVKYGKLKLDGWQNILPS